MRRKLTVVVVLVLGVAGLLASWLLLRPPPREIRTFEDTFRYSFTVRNTSNEVLHKPVFVAYAPASIPFAQELLSLTATEDFLLETDDFGNRIMTFELGTLPPFGIRVITVTARVRRHAGFLDLSLKNAERFLREGRMVPVSSPLVQRLAENLHRDSVRSSMTSVMEFLRQKIEPVPYIREDRGARYALEEGKGDCTEFMYAFSALARAMKVPTLQFGGFLVNGGRLHSGQYHNWSAYHDGDRWVLMDAQNAVHDARYEDYVVFRVFGKSTAHPLGNTHRFVSMDPMLKVILND